MDLVIYANGELLEVVTVCFAMDRSDRAMSIFTIFKSTNSSRLSNIEKCASIVVVYPLNRISRPTFS